MRCHKVEKLLPDYIGDELSAEQRRQIDQHIEGCPNCRNSLGMLRKIWDGLAHQPLPQRGEEFWQEFTRGVMREIRGGQTMPSKEKRGFALPGWRFFLPAAAALLIIVGVIVLKGGLWGPFNGEQQSPWAFFEEQEVLVEVVHHLSFGPMAMEGEGPPGGITLKESPLLAEGLRPPLKPTETAAIAEALTLLFGEDDLYGELEELQEEDLEEFCQLLSSRYPSS
ncbi:MAG: zf-HC2 domain-containing protein [Deltaproteobacteria bacterium]|nr:zf-HC2 domain-containing protein [Deltaproteobacteria bacterium]